MMKIDNLIEEYFRTNNEEILKDIKEEFITFWDISDFIEITLEDEFISISCGDYYYQSFSFDISRTSLRIREYDNESRKVFDETYKNFSEFSKTKQSFC